MKQILLTAAIILICYYYSSAQSQVVTTGNNVVNTLNPMAADIVIGSSAGTRHDASIMFWSNASADRISNTGDCLYISPWLSTNANVALSAFAGSTSYFQGNLLIGQTTQVNTAYKLDVAGPVRANSVVVNTTGADFVFAPTYHLNSLVYVKKYINQNHHLPEIASAKEMQANGLNVGENQTKLLQKVEELTLYLIEKDKQLTEQQKTTQSQQKEIDELKKQMALLLNAKNKK